MAKQQTNKDQNKGQSQLGNTNAQEIKESGSGSGFQKDGRDGNSSFHRKNKGKHFRKNSNDPSWYVANPQLVKDVASLPFAVYNGVAYDTFYNVGKTTLNPSSNFRATVPGVAIYKYMPWYGTATPTSALNLTMRALYSFVRHVNSGKTNYEAPDLMIYIMAMDNIYLLIHEMKRLIRLAYLYVLENRDIPEKVFSALGVDHSDLVGNIANYRAQLNMRIAKANSLAVPANFNLFKRRAVMGSVVLSDEPNRPTQLIVPVTDGFFQFTGTQVQGSTLKWVIPGLSSEVDPNGAHKRTGGDNSFLKSKLTINNYFQLLDEMLAVLLSNEDINIMSGDIIKAYGDNLYKLPFIAENEVQEVIHDENLLLQFSNSTVLDIPTASFSRFYATSDTKGLLIGANAVRFENPSTSSGDQDFPVITQNGGSIVAKCFVDVTKPWNNNIKQSCSNTAALVMLENCFIDTTEAGSISPENVIEWTRLTMSFSHDIHKPNNYNLEAGVEIGLGWLVAQPITTMVVPTKLLAYKNLDQTMSVQWYQFGRRLGLDAKVPLPDIDSIGNTNPIYLTYIVQENINVNFSASAKSAIKYNTMYASKFIEGLNFGPRSYEVGRFNLEGDAISVGGDMAIGKLGEKTAIANRFNISAMHDAALLGLISSPYVTTSK